MQFVSSSSLSYYKHLYFLTKRNVPTTFHVTLHFLLQLENAALTALPIFNEGTSEKRTYLEVSTYVSTEAVHGLNWNYYFPELEAVAFQYILSNLALSNPPSLAVKKISYHNSHCCCLYMC